jgi:hypothetical protein
MKCRNLKTVIGITAIVTALYVTSMFLEMPLEIMLALLGLTFVAHVWMVIRILKDPYSTDKTFDEFFYQDREDLRRNGNE